jgi:hypothetical protein
MTHFEKKSIKRMLVVLSVNDDISLNRIVRYKQRPALSDYEIEYCYCKELDIENRKLKKNEIAEIISEFNKENFNFQLQEKIKKYNPDTLIIHAGFIFNMRSGDFISVFKKIKLLYPSIFIGIEDNTISPIARREIQYHSQLFENCKEMNFIIKNLL